MAVNISFDQFVQATPDEVVDLLTNERFVKDWTGDDAVVIKQENSSFTWFNGSLQGKWIIIAEQKLGFELNNMLWEDDAVSVVEFILTNVEHGTEIHVNHTKIANVVVAERYKAWWKEFFFLKLGDYLANRNLG